MSEKVDVCSFCFECSNIIRSNEKHEKESCMKLKNSTTFNKIRLIENFISSKEEEELIQLIDYANWDVSVTGTKKQEYGPYIDFEKQSLDTVCYTGLPMYSKGIIEKLRELTPAFESFRPFRQRNLEHTGEEWNDSKHFDHSWLFTDSMAILCLLSDVIIRIKVETGISGVLELNVPSRSFLLLTDDYSRSPITFKKIYASTRAILMFYNEIKPSMLEAYDGNTKLFNDMSYFLDSFKGVTISNYVDNQDSLVAEEAFPPPLFINKVECENFNTELLVDLIKQKYALEISNAKLIDGYFDTNIIINMSNGSKMWGKVAVFSILINEKSLNATLPFQRWVAEIRKSPKILPTKENALYIWFDRTKRHFLWIMEYINGKCLSELPSISHQTLSIIGSLLAEFHDISTKYPRIGEIQELSFLTQHSLTSDLATVYKKLFIVSDVNRRKLLFSSFRLIEDYIKLYGIHCHTGIIHTMFNADTIFASDLEKINKPSDLTIAHFANIKYGFYVTDLVFCAIRFLPLSMERALEDIVAIISGYCKTRLINIFEKKLIYPLLIGLSCICYLDDMQVALSKQVSEDEKKRLLDKVEERFMIVEYMYQDSEFQKNLEMHLERFCQPDKN